MRAYWALFVARARTLAQYRVAALAGLATQVVFGFVRISVLIAFYHFSSDAQPMTLQQTITYTWVGQAMLAMLPTTLDRDSAESVRTGAVAYDLTRPLDLYGYWYARAMAMRMVPTLLRAIPMFIFAGLILPASYALQWPDMASLLAWLLATGGMLLLSSAITVLLVISLFWTVSGDGVTRILPHIITIFSGMTIPLPLMPDWMQLFLRIQPFYGVMSGPALLFAGARPAGDVWEILAFQLLWTAIFVLLGRYTLRRGLRRLTVAGG